MDLRAARDVNNGFGDGLAAAFELVVTPLLMGLLGWLVDRWLGTRFVFALGFGLFTFGYMIYKLIMRYSADMARHEADAPWARQRVVRPAVPAVPAAPAAPTEEHGDV